MKRSSNYNTKQREAILGYIISLSGAHVTAAQITEHFAKESVPIGRTTIYRHLDKLTRNGAVRRYTTDGISGACYQYINNSENCDTHLHLKCESCGELKHAECEMLRQIKRHVSDQHSFEVNPLKIVLYGKCEECLNSV
ncbi:MAG: transcriptional repressor [Oscillospiraceae bacterium]|nr:transcriptional repressor [Oscillospiraceae bacterium]